jgi:hypothetical protein
LVYCGASLLLAAALADSALALSRHARFGMQASALAALAGVFILRLLKPLASLRAPAVLRAAGEKLPEVRALLLPAWELGRLGTSPRVSAGLAREHLRLTDEALRRLPRDPVFPVRPPAGLLWRLSAVAAAWALSWGRLGDGTSLQRVCAPWRDVRLESLLDIHPRSSRLPWGSAVDIEARWRIRRDEAPSLWMREEGGPWRNAPWDKEDGRFLYHVGSLVRGLDFRLRGKGLSSDTYSLVPVPYPRLGEISAVVRMPGRGRDRTRVLRLEPGSEIEALAGSWVAFSGVPDRALASGALELSFLPAPVPMRRSGGNRWGAGFPLGGNGTLTVRLESRDAFKDPDPVSFPLKTAADSPPSVELLSPNFELEISPRDRLPVAFGAKDDFGLSSVSLVYRAGAGPPVEIPIRSYPSEPPEVVGDYLWDLSRLPPGASVEFQVKALDNASPRPQEALSKKGVLRTVDFESAHAAAEAGWRSAGAELSALSREEAEAARLMAALEASSADVRGALLKEWEARERELSGRWDSAISAMEQMAASLRADPFSNPGLTGAAEEVSRSMRGLRSGELSKALEAGRSGEFARSRGGHERLASKLRAASEILHQASEFQAMQDVWMDAQRMEAASGELSKALDSMASAPEPPTPGEKRALGEALDDLRRQMDALDRSLDALPKAEPGSLRDRDRQVISVPLESARRSLDAIHAAAARGDYRAAARMARRLAEELSRMSKAVSEAGTRSSGEDEAAGRMEAALKLWKEVAEDQAQALQMTQGIENRRLQDMMSEAQRLLRRLSELQAGVVRDASQMEGRLAPSVLDDMRKALQEFEAGQVDEAPRRLESASKLLRLHAEAFVRFGPPPPAEPPAEARFLGDLAAREESIFEMLRRGVGAFRPGEQDVSDCAAASAVQGHVRRKTGELGRRLDEIDAASAGLPSQARDSVVEAQEEQGRAESSLGGGDAGGARKRQERALELLDRGMKSLSDAAKRQEELRMSRSSPFSRPGGIVRRVGGPRGRTGSEMSFVPLPKSEDYMPPREIRQEVERSLRERRPKGLEEAVRDYFRRMSQ